MNIRIWECKCTQIHIFKKVYAGVKPAFLGKVKDSRLKEIIEKCILPASVRPSAEELSTFPCQIRQKSCISCTYFEIEESAQFRQEI